MRQINEEGLALLKAFEGCKLKSYDDGGGVWTIGYGHTRGVEPGQQITQETAEALLREDLEIFQDCVRWNVDVNLTNDKFSALVCFAFNVGQSAFLCSTLLKLLNAKDYAGASEQFKRWNKVDGKPWLGLTRRRLAERALFLSENWRPFLNYEEPK